MKVSACIITYNHQDYIVDCLEGALFQKVDFDYEIVIGEDKSTDATLKICEEYASKYPDKIRIIKREANLGMIGNWVDTIKSCRGKYIAICEGDDYWTDPLKLQKQFDFLEQNQEYSGCFHKVKTIIGSSFYEDDAIEQRYENSSVKNKITKLDLLREGNFIHTCTFVFRNYPVSDSFELRSSAVVDYLLFLDVASNGYLKRIDEYLAVYRRGVGIYSSLSSVVMERKKLQYYMCVLSLLKDEDERSIFLEKSFNQIDSFESTVKEDNRSYFVKKISLFKNFIIRRLQ